MAWPPAPSPGSVLIVSAELANWLVSNGTAQDAALDELRQQNAALLAELQELRLLLTDPVSGRITARIGVVEPMTQPAHPTDTIDATVGWLNAEGGTIRGDATTTTWDMVDDADNVITGGTINVDPANDEHAMFVPPLQGTNALPFTFWPRATTMNQAGVAVHAKTADSYTVDDTNPVSGTITATLTP